MASMNISLSEPMMDWVESQISSGRYDSASEYVRDLIRHDQDRASITSAMQKLADETLESIRDKVLDEICAMAKRRGKQTMAVKQTAFAYFLSADWSQKSKDRSVYVADLRKRRIRKAELPRSAAH